MKRWSFLLVALVFLFVSSCSVKEKQIVSVAEDFLELYFKTAYDSAATYCTPELENLEEGVREMIVKQTASIRQEIVSVEEANSKDSVNLKYKVYLPSFPNGIDNKMLLVKMGDNWLVAGFGQ
jgi:hypothetical protein